LTICFCLTTAEEEPDQSIITRLKFIRDNTHEKIMLPLSTTEMAILTNLGSNISKAIEFRDNNGREREYPLHLLMRFAKESYFELATFVTQIGKKYSLDIPMRQQQTTFEIPTAPDLISMDSGVVQPLPSVVKPAALPPTLSPSDPEAGVLDVPFEGEVLVEGEPVEYEEPVEGVDELDEGSVQPKKRDRR
jgi:hypothetical protein